MLLKVRQVRQDKLVWSPSKNQGFQVKSYYKALRVGVITLSHGGACRELELHQEWLSLPRPLHWGKS
jgi:hypothetical protein